VPDADGYLDLARVFDRAENISAYALTRVYCLEQRQATILLGSDDMLRLWVNGRLVHEYDQPRNAEPDQDSVTVTLEAGWNTVLAKVVNVEGDHGLYLRIAVPGKATERRKP
jgi:hypothetical protein